MKWSAFLIILHSKERVSSICLDKIVLASLYESKRERRAMSEQEEEVVRHPHCFSYYPAKWQIWEKSTSPTYILSNLLLSVAVAYR